MPRKDDATFVTTTIQLQRGSFERLEKALIGKRNRMGRRITKRAVFQYLLDRVVKDRAMQDQMFAVLRDLDDE